MAYIWRIYNEIYNLNEKLGGGIRNQKQFDLFKKALD